MSRTDDLIRTGDLDGAVAAAVAAARDEPTDARHRLALAEVLILSGDFERADTHLNAAQGLDTSWGLAVALTRQLIRAATWRRETFDAGRPPELVTERTRAVDDALAVLLAERDGSTAVVEDDPALASLCGSLDERPFTGWRDADDRTAGVLELLTATGNYVWIPFEHVTAIRLQPVERLRDTIWRPAEVDVRDGPSGVVYLPAIYHAAPDRMTILHKLGTATDWVEGARVTGLGLRTWLVGDEAVSPADFSALVIGS